ncbi:PilZ domain-containing protein [Thiobaca trueperi]|uniref:PilZ domain-containing protein n=1 Tax=Thiobaca trueperi TaxID=127458 RepID=A0A4R3N159_9GAMM|nr:PilZ domain-containing protein [Thiobaca trueperi]TCT22768.1 PilZ domain-containing protein [Thiobaca trueperi]
MQQPVTESSPHDRRTQARIRVQIPIKVILPGVAEPVTALNEDISWGGALFAMAEPLPQQTEPLRIVLPWKRDEQITADARLLRARPLENGRYLVAVRFVSLSPRSQSRLERLLKMLGAGGTQAHGGPSDGLVRELEVTVNDAEDLRRMLLQIAEGHYSVTVFDAYELDQSIRLSIAGTKDLPGIRLRTRVVKVEKSHTKGFEWADLHTLTLEFEHPRKSLKALASLLLGQLPETQDDSYLCFSEIPSWVRTAAPPLGKSSGDSQPCPVSGSTQRCVLETDFPEALNHLTAGWGDPDAFHELFQSLVMGDHGQPGGWPENAWEEIEFLQNLHDRSYGLPRARQNPLKGGRLA